MVSTYSQLRLIHLAFVFTWFLYLGLLLYLQWPEKPVPIILPVALGIVAMSSISAAQTFRRKLVFAPATALVSDPENTDVLRRWKAGNIVSFAFCESVMLFGVILKFVGGRWSVVSLFFGVGLLLLLFWTPRKIQSFPAGVR